MPKSGAIQSSTCISRDRVQRRFLCRLMRGRSSFFIIFFFTKASDYYFIFYYFLLFFFALLLLFLHESFLFSSSYPFPSPFSFSLPLKIQLHLLFRRLCPFRLAHDLVLHENYSSNVTTERQMLFKHIQSSSTTGMGEILCTKQVHGGWLLLYNAGRNEGTSLFAVLFVFNCCLLFVVFCLFSCEMQFFFFFLFLFFQLISFFLLLVFFFLLYTQCHRHHSKT